MFERFTERARQVVTLSQQAARELRHDYIGTEHVLLGLCLDEEGLASSILCGLGVNSDFVREKIMRIVGEGEYDDPSGGLVPFTSRAKKVLELALREALSLGHNYIGTEHILLGLVRENGGLAARILKAEDIEPDDVRDAVIKRLSGPREENRKQVEREREAAKEAEMAENQKGLFVISIDALIPAKSPEEASRIAESLRHPASVCDSALNIGVPIEIRKPIISEAAAREITRG